MRQTIGDAIDPAVRKQLVAMMVKKAMDIFTEAVKQFVKTVMHAFGPMIKAVLSFTKTINTYLQEDLSMIHRWEDDGGRIAHVG